MKTSESGVQFAFCFYIGGVCEFLRWKITKMGRLASNLNSSAPLLQAFLDSGKSASIRTGAKMLILYVYLLRNIAQIGYSVVSFYSVYMVNILQWVFSVYIQPRQAVRKVPSFPYCENNVTMHVWSSFLNGARVSVDTSYFRKYPRLRVV